MGVLRIKRASPPSAPQRAEILPGIVDGFRRVGAVQERLPEAGADELRQLWKEREMPFWIAQTGLHAAFARRCLEAGEPALAVEAAREGLLYEPQSLVLLHALALGHVRLGGSTEAMPAFARAVEALLAAKPPDRQVLRAEGKEGCLARRELLALHARQKKESGLAHGDHVRLKEAHDAYERAALWSAPLGDAYYPLVNMAAISLAMGNRGAARIEAAQAAAGCEQAQPSPGSKDYWRLSSLAESLMIAEKDTGEVSASYQRAFAAASGNWAMIEPTVRQLLWIADRLGIQREKLQTWLPGGLVAGLCGPWPAAGPQDLIREMVTKAGSILSMPHVMLARVIAWVQQEDELPVLRSLAEAGVPLKLVAPELKWLQGLRDRKEQPATHWQELLSAFQNVTHVGDGLSQDLPEDVVRGFTGAVAVGMLMAEAVGSAHHRAVGQWRHAGKRGPDSLKSLELQSMTGGATARRSGDKKDHNGATGAGVLQMPWWGISVRAVGGIAGVVAQHAGRPPVEQTLMQFARSETWDLEDAVHLWPRAEGIAFRMFASSPASSLALAERCLSAVPGARLCLFAMPALETAKVAPALTAGSAAQKAHMILESHPEESVLATQEWFYLCLAQTSLDSGFRLHHHHNLGGYGSQDVFFKPAK